jgi:hypothetical protein
MTLAQVEARKAQFQCVKPPLCGRCTINLPLAGVSLVHTTKACVLGGGTALFGMASELLELCEVVGRASCGVVVVVVWRSGGPSGLEARDAGFRVLCGCRYSLQRTLT